jgi:hypothetical protein
MHRLREEFSKPKKKVSAAKAIMESLCMAPADRGTTCPHSRKKSALDQAATG